MSEPVICVTPAELRAWAKDIVRAVAAEHIVNTDFVPKFKRRPEQCIDRAVVLLAVEHADLPATIRPTDEVGA